MVSLLHNKYVYWWCYRPFVALLFSSYLSSYILHIYIFRQMIWRHKLPHGYWWHCFFIRIVHTFVLWNGDILFAYLGHFQALILSKIRKIICNNRQMRLMQIKWVLSKNRWLSLCTIHNIQYSQWARNIYCHH